MVKFCELLGILYVETSCKENLNIEESVLLNIYEILKSTYHFPSFNSLYSIDKWNENIHHKFPSSFKLSVFTFLLCLNYFGFGKPKKSKKKSPKVEKKLFPKILVLEIIKFSSSPLYFASLIKQFSISKYNLINKALPLPNTPFLEPEKKKECLIS